MDVVLNAVTPWRGWVIADDLTARSLTGGDWWRVSAAEAVELARVIDRLPRPVRRARKDGVCRWWRRAVVSADGAGDVSADNDGSAWLEENGLA